MCNEYTQFMKMEFLSVQYTESALSCFRLEVERAELILKGEDIFDF